MGAPDNALPVFSFRPDWSEGITERLEWLTDVRTSLTQAEQRESLRLSWRRSFEVEIQPYRNERTFLDLFVRRFSAQEFMLPLWHDHAQLDASVSSGGTALTFDTTDREFLDDGMALLVGPDAFSCEAVQIDAVASGGITLASPVLSNWAAGTSIHPLRRSWLQEKPKAAHETDNLATVPMQFLLSGPQDYDGGTEELVTYAGYPILSPAPDWRDTIDLEFIRELTEVDNKVGLRSAYDPADRAFSLQTHRWMLHGRSEQAAFRRLWQRVRGRQSAIWLPTFTSDMIVAAAAASGASSIDVEQCGLDYADFPADGRELAITAAGDVLQLASLAASPGAGVERINLTGTLAAALAQGEALSFMDIARFDSDSVEIHHLTDSDGVAQVEAPLRTISNTRDGSAVGALALPTAEFGTTNCGCVGCDCTMEIYDGDMTISITGSGSPIVPVADGGSCTVYSEAFFSDLIVSVRDCCGATYNREFHIHRFDTPEGSIDEASPQTASITNSACGHTCVITVTHTMTGPTSVDILVTLSDPHFKFTNDRTERNPGQTDANYAQAGNSHNMLTCHLTGTTEQGWTASFDVNISIGGSTPASPAYEIFDFSSIGWTVGVVGAGCPLYAGQHYNHFHYACTPFPAGSAP